MFAGKTLAEIALALEADPALAPLVQAELESRIARPNARPGSVKRAQAALARMAEGTSVAIPVTPKAEKAPAGTNPNTAQVASNAKQALVKAAGTTQMPEKLAWTFAAKALKAAGYPVPRHIAKAARMGTLAPKA